MNVQLFDFSVNILEALLWQYNNSPRIQGLLEKKQIWYEEFQTNFWIEWLLNVYDLKTANDFGLEVWAIILGVDLTIDPNPDPPGKPIFGFDYYDPPGVLNSGNQNFNNGNFSTGNGVISLSEEEKRLILRLRFYQLNSDGTIPLINKALYDVFEDFGEVYVTDGFDMTMTYHFNFVTSGIFQFIMRAYESVFPRPDGVELIFDFI